MLGWLVGRNISSHIPVIDKAGPADGKSSPADFDWDAENNQYDCAEGEALNQFRRNYSDPRRGPTRKSRPQRAVFPQNWAGRRPSLHKQSSQATYGNADIQSAFEAIRSRRRRKVSVSPVLPSRQSLGKAAERQRRTFRKPNGPLVVS